MSDTRGNLSETLRLRVWGPRACFTRPETKVERVSYDVMTPSAARGILEAVLWRPEMRWIVERIDVLKPIRWASVRRNEVGAKASIDGLMSATAGRPAALGIDIEDERQQRAAIILRDVAYIVHARIALTSRAGSADTIMKYVEMFRRRAHAGQCFQRPYLGTREFAAEFALAEGNETRPSGEDRSLGRMLLDVDYETTPPKPIFFDAQLKSGSMLIPEIRQ